MFNWVKNLFIEQDPLGSTKEGFGGAVTNGETDMTAKIVPTSGKFALVNTRTGQTITTYSRARDAVRGAQRRGLTVN